MIVSSLLFFLLAFSRSSFCASPLDRIELFIFLLLLCFSVQPLRRIPLPCLSIALAVAAGVIFTSMVSFGFWQETWLGIIGLLVICFKVVLQESNRAYS